MSVNIFYPPEWAPQSAVILTWPHQHGDFSSGLDEVTGVYIEISREISAREKLIIACYDIEHQQYIHNLLASVKGINLDAVITAIAPSNDVWARDHGPVSVFINDTPVLLDFEFNGWGGKYPSALDNKVTFNLHQQGAFGSTKLVKSNIILEGGSIETDGQGTLLTTSRCLLSNSRNSGKDRAALEGILKDLLGLNRILWLDHGALEGDDTDSHIDTLARFVDSNTICYVDCENNNDIHFDELSKMKQELMSFRDCDGNPYRLVPLPLPAPVFDDTGNRLPATYANFLVINGAVLLPVYDDENDDYAAQQLATCFPGREIVRINARPLIKQYGSLHCITMQLPAGFV